MRTLKKYWKIILLVVVAIGLGGGIFAYKMYNKPHRNIEKEDPDYSISMSQLLTDFQVREDSANRMYNSNVIALKGNIDEKRIAGDGKVVLLFNEDNGMIKATMANVYFQEEAHIQEAKALSENQQVNLKCKCNGYDDLIEPMVELDNCFINN